METEISTKVSFDLAYKALTFQNSGLMFSVNNNWKGIWGTAIPNFVTISLLVLELWQKIARWQNFLPRFSSFLLHFVYVTWPGDLTLQDSAFIFSVNICKGLRNSYAKSCDIISTSSRVTTKNWAWGRKSTPIGVRGLNWKLYLSYWNTNVILCTIVLAIDFHLPVL